MRSGSWTNGARIPPKGPDGGRETPPPLDDVAFRGPTVTAGAFRCPPWHPAFVDSGPAENDIFVFPRRSVQLQHEGARPFVADPSVVTLHAATSTLHAHRNRLRLTQALERIAAGEDPTRIGLDLGFSSHSHFTAGFRRLFGEAPSVVRARLRPAPDRRRRSLRAKQAP